MASFVLKSDSKPYYGYPTKMINTGLLDKVQTAAHKISKQLFPTNNQILASYLIYSNLNLFAPIFWVNRRKMPSLTCTLLRGRYCHLHMHFNIFQSPVKIAASNDLTKPEFISSHSTVDLIYYFNICYPYFMYNNAFNYDRRACK